jgi:hypothetical protein
MPPEQVVKSEIRNPKEGRDPKSEPEEWRSDWFIPNQFLIHLCGFAALRESAFSVSYGFKAWSKSSRRSSMSSTPAEVRTSPGAIPARSLSAGDIERWDV